MATHHFEPSRYYVTIGSHAPALEIEDGDTVVTSTVDSGGRDASGNPVTEPGNPQTGPFYVRGAMPGDALAITFDRIVPNRRTGIAGSVVAPNVVDPEFARSMPEPKMSTWSVDLERGVVTLEDPADTRIGRLELPLRPMLGCFGVAPSRGQAISTATSGEYGGNMDFNGFTTGTTVYLPVRVEGGLFHLGDGHAAQGDGEIVGTGVEISMDVTFTARVIKGMGGRWPRGENETEIFTLGNARPFDQAIQHATTEMLRWLENQFGFDPYAAHLLLGQAVQYCVGNVFDPAYTAVCRISKRFL